MLWSALAIISFLTITGLVLAVANQGFWQRATSLLVILTIWGLNSVGGAVVFATVSAANRAVWRPLLAISAFIFVGLIAAVLFLQTRYREDDEKAPYSNPGTILAIAFGVLSGIVGLIAIGTVWM